MKRQNGFTPARGARLAATVLAAVGTFTLAICVTAFAQDTTPKPKATQSKKPAASHAQPACRSTSRQRTVRSAGTTAVSADLLTLD